MSVQRQRPRERGIIWLNTFMASRYRIVAGAAAGERLLAERWGRGAEDCDAG